MRSLTGMKVWAHTLGCRLNQYDTDAMVEMLENEGCVTVSDPESADIILINTCTVTAEADRKSRQMLRRYGGPGKIVIAAGCLAQRAGETLADIPGVEVVIGTSSRTELKDKLLAYLESDKPQTDVPVLTRKESYETMRVSHASEHIRMNLKVQEGCDRFCTYCIIPYVRGGLRSRPLKDAIREAEILAASGVPELVLTGIHLASYGKDWGGSPDLMDLLEALDQVPGLMRIRMGSLEPSLLTESFCERLARLNHVCPHVHISLQSGCDSTLKRMNRRYTAEEFRGYVQNLRNAIPGVTVSTDMIVGFPGETESDFETSLSFAREIGFDTIHVFPFSPRSGTPAARMDGMIPKKEKIRRAHLLGEEAERLEKQSLQRHVGRVLPVLIEEIGDDGMGRGFSPEYLHVRCPAEQEDVGRIVFAEIYAAEDHGLMGHSPGKE